MTARTNDDRALELGRRVLAMSPLERAVFYLRGPGEFAERVGVSRMTVYTWQRTGKVSAEHCRGIEEATRNFVRAEELRPDLFS